MCGDYYCCVYENVIYGNLFQHILKSPDVNPYLTFFVICSCNSVFSSYQHSIYKPFHQYLIVFGVYLYLQLPLKNNLFLFIYLELLSIFLYQAVCFPEEIKKWYWREHGTKNEYPYYLGATLPGKRLKFTLFELLPLQCGGKRLFLGYRFSLS